MYAAKAAAMAFLAKKTGGAVANTAVSDSANTSTIDASETASETALGADVETESASVGDVPITSFDGSPSNQVADGEIPIESLAGSIEGDDIPVHSFDDVPVDDMEG